MQKLSKRDVLLALKKVILMKLNREFDETPSITQTLRNYEMIVESY